ncbi:hypothetical protein GCM10009639_13250 [Kitasatospora putterlickiae]|uniref:DUF397 domain-containing protein n=1 Tax=Kitasatospora putterlickiae TaxID=221725 RepID=A0ABN1XRN5_9ACTN
MPQNAWQKSSFSSSTDECVEVRATNGAIELRESETGHIVAHTDPLNFASLLQAIKAGELDQYAL